MASLGWPESASVTVVPSGGSVTTAETMESQRAMPGRASLAARRTVTRRMSATGGRPLVCSTRRSPGSTWRGVSSVRVSTSWVGWVSQPASAQTKGITSDQDEGLTGEGIARSGAAATTFRQRGHRSAVEGPRASGSTAAAPVVHGSSLFRRARGVR
ncbi:MAG: hypothetical protein IPN17_15420 [Deltaproteobacteria bacterium]|nr:hypothetical protein [Deltaproteobacteria bacterium]